MPDASLSRWVEIAVVVDVRPPRFVEAGQVIGTLLQVASNALCRLSDEAQAGVALAGHQGHIELIGHVIKNAGQGVLLNPDFAVIRVGGRVPQSAAVCPLRRLQQVADAAVGAWLVSFP